MRVAGWGSARVCKSIWGYIRGKRGDVGWGVRAGKGWDEGGGSGGLRGLRGV